MTTGRPLHKKRESFARRLDKMGTASETGRTSASLSPPDQFRTHQKSNVELDHSSAGSTASSTPYRSTSPHDGQTHQNQRSPQVARMSRADNAPSTNPSVSQSSTDKTKDLPEQLAHLLSTMIPSEYGKELGCAFRLASEYPPITKDTLSELDIQKIITNIKLRHDINFDRDLSFRPNMDGVQGMEKKRSAAEYWKALVAELELYTRFFQGTPSLPDPAQAELVAAAKRIPKMFETMKDVLKSLVPSRDHLQIDEHLDITLLMQEIERGVCDLVRLAEWLAQLLKEHCAPMRDELVDNMVNYTKNGVSRKDHEEIISGLRQLFGILEAMKLDVANHQIRNLKTLLIEDTVNFERRFHFEREDVTPYDRHNLDHAHAWYKTALGRFRPLCATQNDPVRLHLEVFIRAVTSSLFSPEEYPSSRLPETFFLDQDRLRALRHEVNDLICFDISFGVFSQLLQELGCLSIVPPATRDLLRTSIGAIMGGGTIHGHSYGLVQWLINSEEIALELTRQVARLRGADNNYVFNKYKATGLRLRTLFGSRCTGHAAALEEHLVPQILATVDRHINSSPIELFNNLLANWNPGFSAPAPVRAPSIIKCNTFPLPSALSNAPDHTTLDIANRITHIALLHWRVWGPVAYVLDDGDCTSSTPSTAWSSPHSLAPSSTGSNTNVGPPPAPTPPASQHSVPPFPPPPPPHPPSV